MTITTNPPSDPQARPMKRSGLPAGLWSTRATFRHGQCDPAGIVYTPKFFDVFNQAIEQWFGEALGISYYDIIGARRTGLGYASAAATFFIPCMMGEEIEIVVEVTRIGGKSYTLTLHAFKGEDEALRGQFVTVATALDIHRSIPIPDDIRQALTVYSQGAKR